MTRTEFLRKAALRLNGVSMGELRIILEVVEDELANVIRNKDRVQLFRYMFVSGRSTKPRIMRNPYTGGTTERPQCILPHAEFTLNFKRSLRNKD